MENVTERFKRILVHQSGCRESEVVPTASFMDDLGFDSLDALEVVVFCEDEWGVETVGQAVEYLEKRLAALK